jgi:hypothetical protein
MVKTKLSTAKNLMVMLVQSSDHVTGLAGATLTIASSKDGAAFASITPTVTDRGSGWYNLALTSGHTDTLGQLALHITAASADAIDLSLEVVAYDPLAVANLGLSNLDVVLSTRASAAALATVQADTDDIQTRIPAALVSGRIDASVGAMAAGVVTAAAAPNLDVAVSTRLATAGYTAPDNADIVLIKAKTDNLPTDPADESLLEAAIAAVGAAVVSRSAPGDAMALTAGAVDAVLDEVVTGTLTLRQAIRVIVAEAAGKTSGMGALAPKFRDTADTKDVIVATQDVDGNRLTVTLDVS